MGFQPFCVRILETWTFEYLMTLGKPTLGKPTLGKPTLGKPTLGNLRNRHIRTFIPQNINIQASGLETSTFRAREQDILHYGTRPPKASVLP
jgi:hypothetical protein